MELSQDSIQSQKRTPILRSSSQYILQYLVLKMVKFSYEIKFCIYDYIQYIIPNIILFVIKRETGFVQTYGANITVWCCLYVVDLDSR
jgi:hypothetical protein